MKRRPLVGTLGIEITRDSHAEGYSRLEEALKGAGFDPYFFEPRWQTPNPHHWAQGMAEYTTVLTDDNEGEVFLFGFAAGAVVATLAAALLKRRGKDNVAGLAACSLSSWIGAEQVERTLQTPGTLLGVLPQELINACRKLELPEIDSPVQLYIGGREPALLRGAHEAALERWPHAESIEAPGCRHNVFDPAYLGTLQSNLGRLAV